jgi:hypothetical protein
MDILVVLIILCFALVLYFFPSIVASGRENHNTTAIFVFNLFLGWTLIGWVLALVWAFVKPSQQN